MNEIALDGKGIFDFFLGSFLGWQFDCDKHTLGLESDNMTVFVELHHDSFRQSFPDETKRVIVHDGTLIHTYTTLGEIVKEVATGRFIENPRGRRNDKIYLRQLHDLGRGLSRDRRQAVVDDTDDGYSPV